MVAMAETAVDHLIQKQGIPQCVLSLFVGLVFARDESGIQVQHDPVRDGAPFVAAAFGEQLADVAVRPSGLVGDLLPELLRLLVPRRITRVDGGELKPSERGHHAMGMPAFQRARLLCLGHRPAHVQATLISGDAEQLCHGLGDPVADVTQPTCGPDPLVEVFRLLLLNRGLPDPVQVREEKLRVPSRRRERLGISRFLIIPQQSHEDLARGRPGQFILGNAHVLDLDSAESPIRRLALQDAREQRLHSIVVRRFEVRAGGEEVEVSPGQIPGAEIGMPRQGLRSLQIHHDEIE